MTGGAARNAASRCGSEELTAGQEEGVWLGEPCGQSPGNCRWWTCHGQAHQKGSSWAQRPRSSLEAAREVEPAEDWAGELESQVHLLEDNTPTCRDFASRIPCPALKCLCPYRPLWVVRVVGVRRQDDADVEDCPPPPPLL